jgi:type VI secretion system protein ImpC
MSRPRLRALISAAGAGMFGFQDWRELAKPRDLAKIFDTGMEYA